MPAVQDFRRKLLLAHSPAEVGPCWLECSSSEAVVSHSSRAGGGIAVLASSSNSSSPCAPVAAQRHAAMAPSWSTAEILGKSAAAAKAWCAGSSASAARPHCMTNLQTDAAMVRASLAPSRNSDGSLAMTKAAPDAAWAAASRGSTAAGPLRRIGLLPSTLFNAASRCAAVHNALQQTKQEILDGCQASLERLSRLESEPRRTCLAARLLLAAGGPAAAASASTAVLPPPPQSGRG